MGFVKWFKALELWAQILFSVLVVGLIVTCITVPIVVTNNNKNSATDDTTTTVESVTVTDSTANTGLTTDPTTDPATDPAKSTDYTTSLLSTLTEPTTDITIISSTETAPTESGSTTTGDSEMDNEILWKALRRQEILL
ncbi:hypothetical protein DAPPUDRAFT_96826 [Daphnia pulex]|uniref:Uncharacterized protein n=1 Tax=Daphnia pulex TaxID=6669 RepID=E9FYY9_DAPPU|nr:hypothetical protein DAPPUDRAFT_96826 [Daphnia pulex]|eukprot:EFX87688.1 hypothetical protein DAPPUDRAFT_96826 [Daphnia pulex]